MKQSKSYFIIQAKELFLSSLVLFPIYQLVNNWLNKPFFLGTFLVMCFLISASKKILGYINTTYVIDGDDIFVHYGVLNIRSVNLSKTTGIINYRIYNSWLHKFLNVQGLVINFKNGDEQESIKFSTLSFEKIELLVKNIEVSTEFHDEVSDRDIREISGINITWKKIFLTGLLSANYLLIIPFLLDFKDIGNFVSQYISIGVDSKILLIGLVLFMPFFTIVIQFIKYSQFKISDAGNYFVISNGLINSDNNLIDKNIINGLLIDQKLGMRILGLCSVSVVINNINDDENTLTKNMLFPYVDVENVNTILGDTLPKYEGQFKHLKMKLTITKLMYMFLILLITLLITVNFSFPLWSYIIVLLVIRAMIIPAFTVIKSDENGFLIRRGMFNIKTYIISQFKIGVYINTKLFDFFKTEHVYTDLTPSHHFKEIH